MKGKLVLVLSAILMVSIFIMPISITSATTPITLTLSTPSKDAFIESQGTSDYNWGAHGGLTVGINVISNQLDRTLVQFDLPPELSRATITSATLTLYFNGIWSGTDPEGELLRACRVTRDWTEGTGQGGALTQDGVTWNEYNYFDGLTTTTNNWNTLGGDYTMTDSTTVPYIIDPSTSWTVTDIVQGWASNMHPNYGFLIKFDNESPSESIGVSFDSKDTTEIIHVPQLEITYIPAPIGGTGTLTNISNNQTIMMMVTTILFSTILITVIFRSRRTLFAA